MEIRARFVNDPSNPVQAAGITLIVELYVERHNSISSIRLFARRYEALKMANIYEYTFFQILNLYRLIILFLPRITSASCSNSIILSPPKAGGMHVQK